MPKRAKKPDAVECGTVRLFLCEACGNVHIALVDDDGDMIAHASMPPDTAEELGENIFKALGELSTEKRVLQ